MKRFPIGSRVKLAYIGHIGTVAWADPNGYRYIVNWDSGLTTGAQAHELEAV